MSDDHNQAEDPKRSLLSQTAETLPRIVGGQGEVIHGTRRVVSRTADEIAAEVFPDPTKGGASMKASSIPSLAASRIAALMPRIDTGLRVPARPLSSLSIGFNMDLTGSFAGWTESLYKMAAQGRRLVLDDQDLCRIVYWNHTKMSALVRSSGYQLLDPEQPDGGFRDVVLPNGGTSPHCTLAKCSRIELDRHLESHPGTLGIQVWMADGITAEVVEEQNATLRDYASWQVAAGVAVFVCLLGDPRDLNVPFLKKLSVGHEPAQVPSIPDPARPGKFIPDFAKVFADLLALARVAVKGGREAVGRVKSLEAHEIEAIASGLEGR